MGIEMNKVGLIFDKKYCRDYFNMSYYIQNIQKFKDLFTFQTSTWSHHQITPVVNTGDEKCTLHVKVTNDVQLLHLVKCSTQIPHQFFLFYKIEI